MVYTTLVIIFIILLFVLILDYLNKKLENKNKLKKLLYFVLLILVFFITDFNSAMTGEYVTKPLMDWIKPPVSEVLVEPIFAPILHDNKEYIRVTYKNIGETPLSNIFIEKKYAENFPSKGDRDYVPITITTSYLTTNGDEGYFEFEPPNQTIACKKGDSFNMTIFTDNGGSYFLRKEGVPNDTCIFVPLRIRFYSNEIGVKYFNFLYPIHGEYYLDLYLNGKLLEPYESAPNKEELIPYKFLERCMFWEVFADCKKGFLKRDVCITEGYEPTDQKLICYSNGEKIEFEWPLLNK